jgi:predicted membrane chloride channel (bestrophin family)
MPNRKLKRIVALFLAVILAGLAGFTNITAAADTGLPFKDVKTTNWYYDYVKFVYEEGVMTGLNETTFGPNEPITRAMVVTVLYRLAGEPDVTVNKKPFPDVAKNKWYSAAVAWAKEAGIVGGYANGNFGPNDNIKRQDFVKILKSYCDYICADFAPLTDESYKTKKDAKQVSKYAREYMDWAFKRNLIGQGSDLNPLGDLTRAEAAAMFMRFEMNKGYTYKVIPLVTPLNVYFFIDTDNPDPNSFYFADEDSVYATDGIVAGVMPLTGFLDDLFDGVGGIITDKGGYMALGWQTDGGELRLMRKVIIDSEPVIVPVIGQIATMDTYTVEETDVVVTVPALISLEEYLMQECYDALKAIGEYIDIEALIKSMGELVNEEEIKKFIEENLDEEKIIDLINAFINEEEIKKFIEENLDEEKIIELINAFIDEEEIKKFVDENLDGEAIADIVSSLVDAEELKKFLDDYLNEEAITELINSLIDEEELIKFVDEYLTDEAIEQLVSELLNNEDIKNLLEEYLYNEDIKNFLEENLDEEKLAELINSLIDEDEIKAFIDEYLDDEAIANLIGGLLGDVDLQNLDEELKNFIDEYLDEESLAKLIDSLVDIEEIDKLIDEYLSDEAIAELVGELLKEEELIKLIDEYLSDEAIAQFIDELYNNEEIQKVIDEYLSAEAISKVIADLLSEETIASLKEELKAYGIDLDAISSAADEVTDYIGQLLGLHGQKT